MDIRCVLQSRAVLGEGALWSPAEQVLYWIDQMRPELHRFDPASGRDTLLPMDLPAQLGGLVPRAGGGFALAASDGISLIDAAFATRTPMVNPIPTERATFNDAKCDRQGRLWAGTTDRMETDKIGGLYRIDADGSAHAIADGFICSNGPSFSPDGGTIYHTRTYDREIWAYDIDAATGGATRGRVFATIPLGEGAPDGSTVDAEGCLWSTHWGGGRISRYRPDGSLDRVIAMPAFSPTSCAFGGPDLATLYVTTASIRFVDGGWVTMDDAGFDADPTAGGLFALDVGVRGLAEPAFPA